MRFEAVAVEAVTLVGIVACMLALWLFYDKNHINRQLRGVRFLIWGMLGSMLIGGLLDMSLEVGWISLEYSVTGRLPQRVLLLCGVVACLIYYGRRW